MSDERAEHLRRWHERTAAAIAGRGAVDVDHLGLRLHIPPGVFAPTPVSDLLGTAVLDHTRPDDRVLDMGSGSGVNALLAARRSPHVLGVDINPAAVDAARANAERNALSDRATFRSSDLFSSVVGRFDLVVFDPPFRWFTPRSMAERAITDADYASLGRFFAELPDRLTPGGRALVSFGTSGDIAYLDELIAAAPLVATTVAERTVDVRGTATTYLVHSLRHPAVARA